MTNDEIQEVNNYHQQLQNKANLQALSLAGVDPQLRASLKLMDDAIKNGWRMDMRLGGNCPTLRMVCLRELAR